MRFCADSNAGQPDVNTNEHSAAKQRMLSVTAADKLLENCPTTYSQDQPRYGVLPRRR